MLHVLGIILTFTLGPVIMIGLPILIALQFIWTGIAQFNSVQAQGTIKHEAPAEEAVPNFGLLNAIVAQRVAKTPEFIYDFQKMAVCFSAEKRLCPLNPISREPALRNRLSRARPRPLRKKLKKERRKRRNPLF